MNIQLRVDGGDELVSLFRWLSDSPSTEGTVLEFASVDDGSLNAMETINAIVSSGSALGSLVIATLTWRDARRHSAGPARVRIEYRGTVAELDGVDEAEALRLVERLLSADGDGDGDGEEQTPTP